MLFLKWDDGPAIAEARDFLAAAELRSSYARSDEDDEADRKMTGNPGGGCSSDKSSPAKGQTEPCI
jgi:hypothetical protein